MKIHNALRNRKARAFAMVEVAVGLAVVAFLIVSLYSAITFGFSTLKYNRENLRATQVMLEKLEVVRAYTWSHFRPNPDPDMTDDDEDGENFDPDNPDDPINDDEPPFAIPVNFTVPYLVGDSNSPFSYNGTLVVTNAPISEAYSNSLLEIRIEVTWNSGGGERKRSLRTYFAEYGLQNNIDW